MLPILQIGEKKCPRFIQWLLKGFELKDDNKGWDEKDSKCDILEGKSHIL